MGNCNKNWVAIKGSFVYESMIACAGRGLHFVQHALIKLDLVWHQFLPTHLQES